MKSSAGLLRRMLAALGLAAALTLLLQPVCEKASAPVLAVAPPIPRMALAPVTVSVGLAVWKAPPPQSPSYHARSTRILR